MNKLAPLLLLPILAMVACSEAREQGLAVDAKASIELAPPVTSPPAFVKFAGGTSERAPVKAAEPKRRTPSAAHLRGASSAVSVHAPSPTPEPVTATEPAQPAPNGELAKGPSRRVVKPMSSDDPWNNGSATSMNEAQSAAAGRAPMRNEDPFAM